MADEPPIHWFDDVEGIIRDSDKFKTKLAIGEDAYTTLRLKRRFSDFWNIASTATIAGGVAQSSVVASTFFAPAWLLSALGVTAVTPIGWVVAAAVLSGGACYGVTRYLRDASKDKVTKIPKFINTPIDVLALGLFDLLAPLALKVAEADGHIDGRERQYIHAYLTQEWGYDDTFIVKGLEFTESKLSDFSIEEQARTLAEFKLANRDCNYDGMSAELMNFLSAIMEADGRENKREQKAIADIQKTFKDVGQSWFGKLQKTVSGTIGVAAVKIKDTSETVIGEVATHAEESVKTVQASYAKMTKELKAGSEKTHEALNDLFTGKGDKVKTQKETEVDIISLRLGQATTAELERVCTFLGLKNTANVEEIANAYRSAAGNSFVNMARQFDLAGSITYREILTDVFEKIRPVGDDLNDWTDKFTSIFKKPGAYPSDEQRKKLTIKDIESSLIEMARKQINTTVENMSSDDRAEWHHKAETEIKGTRASSLISSTLSSENLFAKNNAVNGLYSLVSVAASRGAFLVAGGTVAAAVSAILIPVAFSTPAYRKTVNATLEFILIGRRQSAELEIEET